MKLSDLLSLVSIIGLIVVVAFLGVVMSNGNPLPSWPTVVPDVTATPFVITATPGANTPIPTVAVNTPLPGGYDMSCAGLPGAGFAIKNINPCLIGEVKDSTPNGTVICRPEQFSLYSVAANIEGYPDQYSKHARITCEGNGFTIPVFGANGEWGFKTSPTTLEAGCHMLKLTGYTSVNDPDNPYNYMVGGFLEIAGVAGFIELPHQIIGVDKDNEVPFEKIWTFNVSRPASVLATGTVIAAWGTGGRNSFIQLQTLSISAAPTSYCDGEVPEL